MDPRDAVLRVLGERDEALHWTRIQDLALRQGYLDPFEHPDVRRHVQRAIRELAREGAIIRVGKGLYRAQPDEAI
jgi:hypothetical protein